MQTVINNNLRVFQIVTSTGNQFFCNLHDIAAIVKEQNLHPGYYSINHFWNNKAQKVSRKYLREMLEANNLPYNFNY